MMVALSHFSCNHRGHRLCRNGIRLRNSSRLPSCFNSTRMLHYVTRIVRRRLNIFGSAIALTNRLTALDRPKVCHSFGESLSSRASRSFNRVSGRTSSTWCKSITTATCVHLFKDIENCSRVFLSTAM